MKKKIKQDKRDEIKKLCKEDIKERRKKTNK
jgi:hypothetical protein